MQTTPAPAPSPAQATPQPGKTQSVYPDPDTPEWERAQPKYQHCTKEQIDMLFRLRGTIEIAFASDLGLTRKPKK